MTFPRVLEEDLPNFFNFTLVTKPWAQFRQPASAYNSRILTACLHSCSSSREALTMARDAQQQSLDRLETLSPKGFVQKGVVRWHHCISSYFGHQVALLELVANVATRWHYLY